MINIELKPIEESSAEYLYNLYRLAFLETRERYPETSAHEDYNSIKDVQRVLRNSTFDYRWILYEKSTIGAINFGLVELGKICRFRMFFILPEYRNSGLGSATLKIAEHVREPILGWELSALGSNTDSGRFYEKSGYKVQKTILSLSLGIEIVKYGKYKQ